LDGIAERGADHGERDAGIARGRIEDGLARHEPALADTLLDHLERGPVLHRAAGVETLDLAEQADAGRHTVAHPLDLHQRRVANQLEHRRGAERSLPRRRRTGGVPRLGDTRRHARSAQRPPAIAGTIDSSSPAFTGVSRCWRKRMSSPLTKMLTKRRTWPDSSQMRSRMPG